MAFQLAVGEKISNVISLISMLIAGLIFSFYIGWILTFIVLGCLPIIAFFWYKDANTRMIYLKKRDEMFNESDRRVQEAFSSIRMVKQMNAESFELDLYERNMDELK
jgi:ABC-type bacteriocin/lantibiotic exporter with double-glycine peptidase domain